MSRESRLKITATLAAVAAALAATAPPARAQEPTVERVTVRSFDGTALGGWVVRPAGSEGRKLPTILISTPYFGVCIRASFPNGPCWPTPETREKRAYHPEPVDFLVERGYAVGWFSVRGTGVSGGCWDDLGSREQRDQRVLVDWLARQDWSNGRVGAMGISAMAATALAAAVQRPKALETVVVSGVLHDLYTFQHSPQGLATFWTSVAQEGTYGADVSLVPPGLVGGDPHLTLERAPTHHERACPELLRTATAGATGAHTGMRDAGFFEERNMTKRLRRVRASVLIAHGLQDLWQSGHMMQEDTMWAEIRAPKAMYVGQWEHSYPYMAAYGWEPVRPDLKEEWFALLDSWLGHYLKGGPKPAIVGEARFEDESGTWHESDRWPPSEARDEALYTTPGGTLEAAPPAEDGGASFRPLPPGDRAAGPRGVLCPLRLDPIGGPGGLVLSSAPVTERTVVAGNPKAYLDIEADHTAGGFQVTLFDLAPNFDCATPGRPVGARRLTVGAADLRFHRGNLSPRPFDGGHVRVDIANLAAVLEPGHRLAMVLGFGDPLEFVHSGHAPRVTVSSGPRVDSSHLVVPVLEGGFGGSPAGIEYPRRPFTYAKRAGR